MRTTEPPQITMYGQNPNASSAEYRPLLTSQRKASRIQVQTMTRTAASRESLCAEHKRNGGTSAIHRAPARENRDDDIALPNAGTFVPYDKRLTVITVENLPSPLNRNPLSSVSCARRAASSNLYPINHNKQTAFVFSNTNSFGLAIKSPAKNWNSEQALLQGSRKRPGMEASAAPIRLSLVGVSRLWPLPKENVE
jgi:hypothetical protein